MPNPDVLVVDDRANMLQLLQKVLASEAIVHTAASGSEAIAILEGRSMSAVVCDLRLPDMSGIDVLRACRRLCPSAEFVLMTAYGSVPTAVEAMREGAYDYITKPFDPGHLRAVVQRALSRSVALAAFPSGQDSAALQPPTTAEVSGTLAAPEMDEANDGHTGLLAMTWHEAMELGRRETARLYLQAILRKYSGRISDAAVHAGVERESFYRLLRRYRVQLSAAGDPEKQGQ